MYIYVFKKQLIFHFAALLDSGKWKAKNRDTMFIENE